MHRVFGITYLPAGAAERFLGRDTPLQAEADPVTRPLIAAWVTLNAALVVAATLGAALMLLRRRVAAVTLVAAVGGLVWWMSVISFGGAGEGLRLIVLPLQAMLVGGLFVAGRAHAPVPRPYRTTPPGRVTRPSTKAPPHPALALGSAASATVPTPTGRPI